MKKASLRGGSHFRCYKRCGASGEAASYESARGLARENFRCYNRCGASGEAASSFLVPDPSPARCARRLVTRGFTARATSIITTKMRACSQARRRLVWLAEIVHFKLTISVTLYSVVFASFSTQYWFLFLSRLDHYGDPTSRGVLCKFLGGDVSLGL